ncbi:MAG TPA: hypothetical protein VJU61_20540 [Polyangiaceae bacterium]|nr:hypothetical protein [Polyangiaceae bacterium]
MRILPKILPPVVGVVGFVSSLLSFASAAGPYRWYALGFAVAGSVGLFLLFRNTIRDGSTDGLKQLRQTCPLPADLTPGGALPHLRRVAQSVSDAFTAEVGADVACSIQSVTSTRAREGEPPTLWLVDVARDKKSQNRTDRLLEKGIRQLLEASSTQWSVFQSKKAPVEGRIEGYYFSHDVSLDVSFQCALLSLEGVKVRAFPLLGALVRWWRWPLYRSRIVVAIVSEQAEPNGQQAVLGFLSIDCKAARAFCEKRDVELLKIVAGHVSRAVEQLINASQEKTAHSDSGQTALPLGR